MIKGAGKTRNEIFGGRDYGCHQANCSTEKGHSWKKLVCRRILYGRSEEQDQKGQKSGEYDRQDFVDKEERISRKEHTR